MFHPPRHVRRIRRRSECGLPPACGSADGVTDSTWRLVRASSTIKTDGQLLLGGVVTMVFARQTESCGGIQRTRRGSLWASSFLDTLVAGRADY